MSALFDELKEGLQEAIDYEKGSGTAKVTTYHIYPLREYSNSQIRELRMKKGMSQTVFASFMGVSKKTVEAWEGGRTHPTGSACRLMDVLDSDTENKLPFVKVTSA